MTEIIEKIKQYRKETTFTFVLLLVIILVIALFVSGVFGTDKLPFIGKSQKPGEIDDFTQSILDRAKTALENESGMVVEEIKAPQTQLIKIATLAPQDSGIDGTKAGCDVVRMVYRSVPKTTAILNATMQELFAYDQAFDYMPGNFVANQENLSFDRATIENGIAKIYLTGSVTYAGVCDDPRLSIQVTETAKQFATVNDVQIYLNGNLYQVPNQKGE